MQNKITMEPKKKPALGLILRLYWFLWGYFPIFYFAKVLAYEKDVSLSFIYTGFAVSFLVLAASRYIDMQYFEGETTDGKPMTMKIFFIWAIKVFVILSLFLAVIQVLT